MRRTTALILIAVLLAAPAASAATLCWNYDDPAVDGFRIYSINSLDLGVIEPDVVEIPDPAARSYVLPAGAYLEGQTYVFWATAYAGAAESPKSDSIQWTVPEMPVTELPAPWGLKIR